MNYFVKRGDQEYGPYTLAVLQQYISQGNISLQDLARSEGMNEWMPVSSIVGNVQVVQPQRQAVIPSLDLPKPPGMHWAVLLLLMVVTFGIFAWIWMFVQASWVRRVRPASTAIFFFAAYLGGIFGAMAVAQIGTSGVAMGVIMQLAGFGCFIVGIFKMRSDIEDFYQELNPVGIHLSGVMTFFFNTIYFQYHLKEIKQLMESIGRRASAQSA